MSPFSVGVAARICAQICAFVLILVASRALDLAEFGAYVIASAISVIAVTLVYTGIYHAILRSTDIEGSRDTFFTLLLAVGGAGAAVMLGLGAILGGPSASPTSFGLISLAPIPILASLSAWYEALLLREGRVRTTALATLCSEVVGLGAALGMFFAGFGIEALICSRFASMAFILLTYGVLVKRLPHPNLDLSRALPALHQAWPLWGSASLGMMSNYGADLVLGAFLTAGAVGTYRAGSRVANTAADVVIQPLGLITWTRFSRLESQSSRDKIRGAWTEIFALGFALIVPAMVCVSLLSEDIVRVLLDPAWAPAAGIIAILALARATDSLSFLLEPTLTCLGRGRLQFLVRLGDAILLIALLLLLGRWSAEAAATAILIKATCLACVTFVLSAMFLRLSMGELVRALSPGIALAILCYGIVTAAQVSVPASFGPIWALAATLGLVVFGWSAVVGSLLYRRVLVLPTP